MEKKERTELPMVCVCQAEGLEEADQLRREVEEKLNLPIEDSAHFVTAVIASLWWDLSTTVRGIYMDMWFGVKVSTEDGVDIWIECDRVEDGLAAIWKHLADKRDESGV